MTSGLFVCSIIGHHVSCSFLKRKIEVAAEGKSVLCHALVAGFWVKQILTEGRAIASSLKARHFPEHKIGQTG